MDETNPQIQDKIHDDEADLHIQDNDNAIRNEEPLEAELQFQGIEAVLQFQDNGNAIRNEEPLEAGLQIQGNATQDDSEWLDFIDFEALGELECLLTPENAPNPEALPLGPEPEALPDASHPFIAYAPDLDELAPHSYDAFAPNLEARPAFSSEMIEGLAKQFPWLVEEKEGKGTYLACAVCQRYGTSFFGWKSLEVKSLPKHGISQRHAEAVKKQREATRYLPAQLAAPYLPPRLDAPYLPARQQIQAFKHANSLADSILGEVNKAVDAGASLVDVCTGVNIVVGRINAQFKRGGLIISTPDKITQIQGLSTGLANLGNTCYMNATLQCLHAVPELKSALMKYPSSITSKGVDQSSHSLIVATKDLFNELDKNVQSVVPNQFLMALRIKYPLFAQLQDGTFMQQDAEECWTQLLSTLSFGLTSYNSSEEAQALKKYCGINLISSEDGDVLKNIFGIDLVSRIHCAESGEESTEMESFYSLKCYIPEEVNHLHEGLKHALKSEFEKFSPSLGQTAVYTKDYCINDLPRYLTVQFVRFLWNRETNQKIKILRKVDFPLSLDVYDLCSDDLRKRLELPRRLRDEEGKKAGLETNESSLTKDNDVEMTDAEGSSNAIGDSSVSAPAGEGAPPGKEKHLTGIYDLVAVLTHKGSSADSGHYVAWVKQENGKWIQFDDDNPYPRGEEDIARLSGGDDWHMAYICMYKSRDIT